MGKGLLLAPIRKHTKPLFKLIGGLFVHLRSRVSAEEIFECGGIGIILAAIDLASRYAVTEHFGQIAHRHGHRLIALRCHVEVIPILKMVFVSALVVHPCERVAKKLPLLSLGC